MSGVSGSGTGSDSISVRTTSREATPISDAESASSSMIAGQTNSSALGGPLIHGTHYHYSGQMQRKPPHPVPSCSVYGLDSSLSPKGHPSAFCLLAGY